MSRRTLAITENFNSSALGAGTVPVSDGSSLIGSSITDNATSVAVSEPISMGGKMTTYNGIVTVSGGIPSELATVDLTAQTAAVGTTTLYTTTAAGQFRLSWNVKVTTVASTGAATSTLGALTIVYTDPDSVAQTITAAAQVPAGTIATTNAGNTTTSSLIGLPLTLNCKSGTVISYAMAYASNTANQMAYNLHIKLEAL